MNDRPWEIRLTPAQRWHYQRNRGRQALERIDEYNARVRYYRETGRAPAPKITNAKELDHGPQNHESR